MPVGEHPPSPSRCRCVFSLFSMSTLRVPLSVISLQLYDHDTLGSRRARYNDSKWRYNDLCRSSSHHSVVGILSLTSAVRNQKKNHSMLVHYFRVINKLSFGLFSKVFNCHETLWQRWMRIVVGGVPWIDIWGALVLFI
jgi:hypothetical protein